MTPKPPTAVSTRPKNLVPAIERAALVLGILREHPTGLGGAQIAGRTGLTKGMVHRLLAALGYFDYVRQEKATRHCRLGFKLVERGNGRRGQIDRRDDARPFLVGPAEDVAETVHLVVCDDTEALHVDKVNLHPKRSGLKPDHP